MSVKIAPIFLFSNNKLTGSERLNLKLILKMSPLYFVSLKKIKTTATWLVAEDQQGEEIHIPLDAGGVIFWDVVPAQEIVDTLRTANVPLVAFFTSSEEDLDFCRRCGVTATSISSAADYGDWLREALRIT